MGKKCSEGDLGLRVRVPDDEVYLAGADRWEGRACVRKCPVKAAEMVGRGFECELGRVQGSRIGVSGGARTK